MLDVTYDLAPWSMFRLDVEERNWLHMKTVTDHNANFSGRNLIIPYEEGSMIQTLQILGLPLLVTGHGHFTK